MCTRQINNPIPFSVATAKQELSKHSLKNNNNKTTFYSTGCTDPNDKNKHVIIAVTRVRLEIYWHKLLARKSFRQEQELKHKSKLL